MRFEPHKLQNPLFRAGLKNCGRQTSLRLLFLLSHQSARGALAKHFISHGRLFESRSSLEFLQYSRSLVFLFEASERPVDRFVFLYDNSYQVVFFPFLSEKLVGRFNGLGWLRVPGIGVRVSGFGVQRS
jgi:hypothetical protein